MLSAPAVGEVIDFEQPVAVLVVAVAHFLSDQDDPRGILGAYRNALAPGSYLALTHGSTDYDDPVLVEQFRRAVEVYRDGATPVQLRSRETILELFGDLTVIPPGLVDISRWLDTGDPATTRAATLGTYGAIGRR